MSVAWNNGVYGASYPGDVNPASGTVDAIAAALYDRAELDAAPRYPESAFAAAERRGYDRAVANLRQLAENTTGTFRQMYRNGADWLEEHATKETTL